MTAADTSLLTMIATLRKLAGPDVVREITAAAAPGVDKALKATASAGTSPDGAAWPETKAGGRPMANAAEHITTKAVGGRIRVALAGPDVWHQMGARGEPKRAVIPEGPAAPPGVQAAMLVGANKVFDRYMGAL